MSVFQVLFYHALFLAWMWLMPELQVRTTCLHATLMAH